MLQNNSLILQAMTPPYFHLSFLRFLLKNIFAAFTQFFFPPFNFAKFSREMKAQPFSCCLTHPIDYVRKQGGH